MIENNTYQQFRKDQKTFVSTDGNIKYIDKGKGDVILLLHGIPTSSWLYRKMIDELVDNGFRVIVPDMLGFGGSDNPKGYELYAPEQHAKRILELMDELNVETWNHVMHDAGGLWTWELIEKNQQRIKKLILLNTIIYEEGFNPPVKMKKGVFAKISMWMYKNRITTNLLLNQLFKKGLMENNLTNDEIEGYRKPLVEGKVNGMYYFFSNTCTTFPNYQYTIEKLNIPVGVIWGKNDTMLKWESQKEKVIKSLNIKAKNIHLIESKHFIQEEEPALINSILIAFFK